MRAFICSYGAYSAFKFTNLDDYEGKPVRIQLEDDHPIFRRPYKLNIFERDGVKLQCKELCDASLVELSDGEYACAKVVPVKDILRNWTKKHMCGNYRPVNK